MSYGVLFKKCNEKKFNPDFVAEVGVYLPQESNVRGFIFNGAKALLVEADPLLIDKIKMFYAGYKNIDVLNYAIFDRNGTVELYRAAASTFVSEVISPALVNDKYVTKDSNKFTVEARLFSEIDNGNIDLLSVDIEGSEWFVIKNMVSHPKVISIETHGKYYRNQYIKEISDWMYTNGYTLWFKDKSDSVYVKNGTFPVTFGEKLQLKLMETRLYLRRLKRFIK
jgi:FkbM family methyltransferase